MKIKYLRLVVLLQAVFGILILSRAFSGCATSGTGAASNAEPGPVHDHAANEMGIPEATSPGDAPGIAGSSSGNGLSGALPPGPEGFGESQWPKWGAKKPDEKVQRPATEPSPSL